MRVLFLLALLSFLPLHFGSTKGKPKKVTFVLLGDVGSSEQRVVKNALQGYYDIKIEELSIAEIPAALYINKTDTLSGTAVLNYIQTINPNTTGSIVAITETALSLGNGGFTIRGLANAKLNSCVISTAKLKLQSESEQKFRTSLVKVARHEYGHILGLNHCELSDSCLMIQGHDQKDFLSKMGTTLCKQCNQRVALGLR